MAVDGLTFREAAMLTATDSNALATDIKRGVVVPSQGHACFRASSVGDRCPAGDR